MNLDISLINVSAYILSSFKRRNIIRYDELLDGVKNNLEKDSEEILPYALNFLYLLNKINYEKNKDSFILNEVK
ncbi:ABC-three component system middle component 6 [Tenacibaculum xiamenense]|uniref:ABC-three component system middle component 6 n=1 Tax=Tenacibaculum xiamenense TaxID=1261553 RepID=UPI0038B47456